MVGVVLFIAGAPLFLSSIERDLETRTLDRAAAVEPLVNGVRFSGQDGTVFCTSPVEFPAQLVANLAEVRGVHSITADRTCRVLRAPTVDGSSTAASPTTTTVDIGPTSTSGSSSNETTTTESLPVSDDELLISVLESDPELTTMSRLVLAAGIESRLSDVSVVLAPVDGAFDQLGADLLAEIESTVSSIVALVDIHMLESANSTRVSLVNGVTTIDGYSQVIEILEVGGREIWLIDTVLQADGTGVLPLLQVDLTNRNIEVSGSSVSTEVLEFITDAAEGSDRTLERMFGEVIDDDAPDLVADVISLGGIERLIRAMLATLETGVLNISESGASLTGTYLDETRAASMEAVARSVGAAVLLAPPAPVSASEVDALNDKISETLAGSPVNFISGRAEFVFGSDRVLADIAKLIVEAPGVEVTVRGHTDSDGVPASNLQLSADRAAAVAAALIAQGVDETVVRSEGVGSAEPIIVEGVEDKVLSRRVEILVSIS